jgi:hypothetical protein
MTKTDKLKEEFVFYAMETGYDIDKLWSWIEKAIQEAVEEREKSLLKAVIRADKKYPLFANPAIGSISFRDWLKKKLHLIKDRKDI